MVTSAWLLVLVPQLVSAFSIGDTPFRSAMSGSDMKYVGCYFDDDLLDWNHLSMDQFSLSGCLTLCRDSRFRYMGVAGGYCFCGENIPDDQLRLPDDQCDRPCPGEVVSTNLTCGGDWYTSVYDLEPVITPNGQDDCGDASDEKNCTDTLLHRPCTAEEFQCGDKLCIPRERVCDGTIDCLDKSDELSDCTKNGSLDVLHLVKKLNELGAGTRNLSFPYSYTNIQSIIVNGVNITNIGHMAEVGGERIVRKKMFKLYLERLTWHGAFAHCASNGMALASIESEEEQNAVRNLIKQAVSDRAQCNDYSYCTRWWLGGSDLHDDGNYIWYSNGRPLTYRHFHTGEPNALGTENDCLYDKEHCIEMRVESWFDSQWDYEWNDTPCTRQSYAVCEYFN